MAAAACSGGRVRRKQAREAQRILARETLLRHRKELQKKARIAFDELKTFVALADHDNGNANLTAEEEKEYEYFLAEANFEDFMESVMGIPKEGLDQHALQLVKDTARKNQQRKLDKDRQRKQKQKEEDQKELEKKLKKEQKTKQQQQEQLQEQRPTDKEQSLKATTDVTAETTSDTAGATTTMDASATDSSSTTFGIPKGHYTQHALVNAIDKYGFYLENAQKVNAIFQEFDTNKDGELSRSELRNALVEHERKHANRYVRGIHVFLVVSNKDLDFILQQADADRSGKINRAELLPALAIWENLAAMHIQEKENGCACIIL